MKNADEDLCPNCARPRGVEYRDHELERCHLWRLIVESGVSRGTSPQTVLDCFSHTQRRIQALHARVADLTASKNAAQSALRRHG